MSPESTFLASVLLCMHCWKRLYETTCVNIFSDKMMNTLHYLIGFYHYIGTLLCVIGESEGFSGGNLLKYLIEYELYFNLFEFLIQILMEPFLGIELRIFSYCVQSFLFCHPMLSYRQITFSVIYERIKMTK